MRAVLLFSSIAIGFLTMSAIPDRQINNNNVVKETYIHKYGMPVPANDWSERGQHGQVVTTLKNGVVITKTFEAGMLDGPTTFTFPHSSAIEKTQIFVKGNLIKEVTHYRSGPPREEVQHIGRNAKSITSWYENGTPKSHEEFDNEDQLVKGEYYNSAHTLEAQVDNKNGIRIIRNQYGLVQYKDTIENGDMVVRTTFHHNGYPKEITPYKDHIVEGVRQTFLPDGEPSTIELWADGRQQGITTLFQNGEKFAEVPYSNGQKNGLERRYKDGKFVVEDISWYNGLQEGPRTVYADDVASTEWYFEGNQVPKVNYQLRVHASNRPYVQHFPL